MLEMVVVMGILALVVAGLGSTFHSVQKSQAFSSDRSETLDDMRIALERMTKEIRQASDIAAASTSSRLEMTTYVQGVETTIVYEAVGTELRKTVAAASTYTVVQERLTGTALFVYAPGIDDARVVTVTLSVNPERTPETTLVLTSEVRLRNVERATT